MAEFDPLQRPDASEAAYRDALLRDDAGAREARRARLMAALPPPAPAAPVPVTPSTLAWRWHPYAWGGWVAGVLLAAALLWRLQPAEPGPQMDPRLAAAPPASAPTVVAQAEPVVKARPVDAAPPRVEAVAPTTRPSATRTPPVVVAEASRPPPPREPPVADDMSYPSVAPAAPASMTAAAGARDGGVLAESAVPAQPEGLGSARSARSRTGVSLANSLAASEVAPPGVANAVLLAAATHKDVSAARSALQSGASVHQRDVLGRTPLMLAAQSGARDVVELLLAAGALKTDRDSQGWTAADHAQALGHDGVAQLLR